MKSWYRHGMAFTGVLLVLGMVLAGCGSGSGGGNGSGATSMTVAPSPVGTWTQNDNPYSPNVNYDVQGLIYETLLYINPFTGKVSPWLADTYNYSSDGLTLTFHLHPGVKWSDGQAFTSSDVVFTFNMLKQYPAIDGNGIWQTLSAITNPDDSTVVMTLNKVDATFLYHAADQTWIVPQHIWSTLDPTKTTNTNPVGTGPYMLKSFTPSLYIFDKNPTSWQAANAHVSEIRFPAFGSNASADLVLASGQLDWAGVFATDMQKVFVQPDPQHHFIFSPPNNTVTLFLNLSLPIFKSLAVRQAISVAIDRSAISTQAEEGLEQIASPTGMVLPSFKQYLDPSLANASYGPADASKADQILEAAGFKKGSDGIYADASGNKLSFKLEVPEGWSDWDAGCQIISNDLKQAGIDAEVDQVDFNSVYLPDVNKGTYQAVMHWTNGGPTPYYQYNALLNSQFTAAAGQSSPSNIEGWNDPATDAALAEYANSIDPNVQQDALNKIQNIMVNQLPVISLVEGADWNEYSTKNWVGWPTQSNLYAGPAPFNYPDNEQVILHLTQA